METTFSSSTQGIRSRLEALEALELALLGFGLWCAGVLLTLGTPDVTFLSQLSLLVLIEAGMLGSWLIYLLYIRIARAAGRRLDIGLWIIAAAATASYTFWAWTLLDLNRLLVSKLFYRGAAPVEYAWSARSKQMRKAWQQAQKAAR